MNLTTNYLGLKLKNPIIIGASNLVSDINMAKKLEEAGAAAFVYKSLFQEQLELEAADLEDELHAYDERNAEMITLFPKIEHSGPKAHLLAIKKLKEAVSVPVIASLNCTDPKIWVEYAIYLEKVGIDALELNFYNNTSTTSLTAVEVENDQISILQAVKKAVKIPVSVKLSPFYSNTLNVVKRMDDAGANGFVLFNKLFQPDIDIENQTMRMPYNLSNKGEYRLSLRYTGLLFGQVKGEICSNTGILDGEDLIALLLSGASTVQVVSTIYKNGPVQISRMLSELETFMTQKGYQSINDFKGKLSKSKIKEPFAYQRAQYIDYLMKSKDIIKQFQI